MRCPTCGAWHFDGAFQRCEDCRAVHSMEEAMEGGWITPVVRRALAETMAGHIQEQLGMRRFERKFFPILQVDSIVKLMAEYPIQRK